MSQRPLKILDCSWIYKNTKVMPIDCLFISSTFIKQQKHNHAPNLIARDRPWLPLDAWCFMIQLQAWIFSYIYCECSRAVSRTHFESRDVTNLDNGLTQLWLFVPLCFCWFLHDNVLTSHSVPLRYRRVRAWALLTQLLRFQFVSRHVSRYRPLWIKVGVIPHSLTCARGSRLLAASAQNMDYWVEYFRTNSFCSDKVSVCWFRATSFCLNAVHYQLFDVLQFWIHLTLLIELANAMDAAAVGQMFHLIFDWPNVFL